MASSLPSLRDHANLQQQDSHTPLGRAQVSPQPLQSIDLFLQALGLVLFVFGVVSKGAR